MCVRERTLMHVCRVGVGNACERRGMGTLRAETKSTQGSFWTGGCTGRGCTDGRR